MARGYFAIPSLVLPILEPILSKVIVFGVVCLLIVTFVETNVVA